ncbi:Non-histone chromosomal protein 6 [Coemansia sp. IMI 209128]|nr:Non-histone chromosomal protein 6 [Coemansia sp. IMI 209128]
MRDSYSFSREESKQLADAFSAMAEVLELANKRARQPHTSHVVAARESTSGTKPVPPLLACKLYYRDYVESVKAQHPDFSTAKVSGLIASRWKAASEDVRAAYMDQHKALMRQYEIDVAVYDAQANLRERASQGRPAPTVGSEDAEPSEGAPSEPQSPAMSVASLSGLRSSSLSLSPIPLSWTAERTNEDEDVELRPSRERPVSVTHPPLNGRREKPSENGVVDMSVYNARKAPFLSAFPRPVSVVCSVEPFLSGRDEEVLRVLGPRPYRFLRVDNLFKHLKSESNLKASPKTRISSSRRGLNLLWKRTSMKERQPYIDYFRAMTEQYNDDIVVYDARVQALLVDAFGKGESSSEPTDVCVRILGRKPPHPVHAVNLYFSDVAENVLKDTPGLGRPEVMKLVSARWKSASKEERQVYLDRHKALMDRYNIDYVAYDVRKHALLKDAIRKLGLAGGNSAATVPLSYSRPEPSPSTALRPQLFQRSTPPALACPPLQCSAPSLPTQSGRAGLPLFPPLTIGSSGLLRPIGLPAFSQATLPSAPRLSGPSGPSLPSVFASQFARPSGPSWPSGPLSITPPALSLTALWPAEVSRLLASSCGLPKPTTLVEDALSSAPAMPSRPVSAAEVHDLTTMIEPAVPPESVSSSTRSVSLGLPDTAEAVAVVETPASAVASPAPAMPIEGVELPMLSKKKSKKKRKHTDEDDLLELGADQSSRPHRKKKKHKSPAIIMIDSNTDEAATDKENCRVLIETVKTGS